MNGDAGVLDADVDNTPADDNTRCGISRYENIRAVINDPAFCLYSLINYTNTHNYTEEDVISAMLRVVIRLPETAESKYRVYMFREIGSWKVEAEHNVKRSMLRWPMFIGNRRIRVTEFLRENEQYFPPRQIICRPSRGWSIPYTPYVLDHELKARIRPVDDGEYTIDSIRGAQPPRLYTSDEPVEITFVNHVSRHGMPSVTDIKGHVFHSWCAGNRELYKRVTHAMAQALFAPETKGIIILVKYDYMDSATVELLYTMLNLFNSDVADTFSFRDIPICRYLSFSRLRYIPSPLGQRNLVETLCPDGYLPRALENDTVTLTHKYTAAEFTMPNFMNFILCTRERHLPELHPSVLVLDALPCFVGDKSYRIKTDGPDDRYVGGLYGYLWHIYKKTRPSLLY